MKAIAVPLAVAFLAACAPVKPVAENGRFTHEGVNYRSLDPSASEAKFRRDIEPCHSAAQQQYETELQNLPALTLVYGPLLTPEVLAHKRRVQVVDCMTGNMSGAENGKVWVVEGTGR